MSPGTKRASSIECEIERDFLDGGLGCVIKRAAKSKTSVLMKSCAWLSMSSIFSTSRRRSLSSPQTSSRNAARLFGSRSSAASNSSSTFRQRSGFILDSFSHHAIQPRLRSLPLASHSPRRNVQDFCCFLDAQTAEVTQLDDLAFLRIETFKHAQRFVKGDEVCGLVLRYY